MPRSRLLTSIGVLACLLGTAETAASQASDPATAPSPIASTPALALEQQVVAEINRARSNPSAYADWLETQRSHYSEMILRLPGESPLRTREGVAALDDAIASLRSIEPLPSLALSSGMSLAARDHAIDMGLSGTIGGTGSDGSNASDRMSRYGSRLGQAIELSSYGKNTAEAIVLLLIVNDGFPDRPFRTELFSASYGFTGVACRPHITQRSICVLNYATQFAEETPVTAAPAAPPTASAPTSPPTAPTIDRGHFANLEAEPTNETNLPTEETNTPRITAAPAPTAPTFAIAPAPRPQAPAPTAPTIDHDHFATLEIELTDETNLLRSNPSAYAEFLVELRQYYDGNLLRLPDHLPIETQEGVAALDEAIAELQRTAPRPTLTASRGLSQGAEEHVSDQSKTGQTGHYGSNGSDPFERIDRYGTRSGLAGENISYSPIHSSARWHILQLLIDDGVFDRGHRRALLNPEYRLTGAACSSHPDFREVCVMTYAAGFTEFQQD